MEVYIEKEQKEMKGEHTQLAKFYYNCIKKNKRPDQNHRNMFKLDQNSQLNPLIFISVCIRLGYPYPIRSMQAKQ